MLSVTARLLLFTLSQPKNKPDQLVNNPFLPAN
jgi:hypothetical protein